MNFFYVFLFSLLSGWAVNLLADGLPERRNWLETLRSTWHQMQKRQGRHLIVFAAAIALGELAYIRSGWSLAGFVLATQAWFFLTIAVIDLEHRRVLNRMLLPALPFILLSNWMVGLLSLQSSLSGALLGFGVFLLLALLWRGAMGMGDVKLAGVIGLATGFLGTPIALLVSFYVGGIAAVIIMLRSRKRGQTMAYAPYLVVGAWVALFFSKDLWRLYLSII